MDLLLMVHAVATPAAVPVTARHAGSLGTKLCQVLQNRSSDGRWQDGVCEISLSTTSEFMQVMVPSNLQVLPVNVRTPVVFYSV